MNNKWTVPGKGKERAAHAQDSETSVADDHRAAVQQMMETEFGNIIKGDIKAATIELADEQRRAIREAVDEQKRIIRDVLEQEKLAIRARKEELRESIIRHSTG